MIKIIAFDLGDVLVKDTLKHLGNKYWTSKISASSKQKFLNALHEVDTGKRNEHYLIKAFQENLAPTLTIGQIEKHMKNTKLLPPWKLMKQLSKNYPIAILTNNYKNGPANIQKLLKIDLSPYHLVNSAKVGVRKPFPKFFEIALKKLKINPAELIFIDDRPANVKGAKAVGIKAFCYNKNMAQLRQFLKRNGILGV